VPSGPKAVVTRISRTEGPLYTSLGHRPRGRSSLISIVPVYRVSKPEVIEYALQRFQEELQKRLRDLQEQTLKAAGAVASLQNQRRELKGQAQNPGEAIAKIGHSATLLQQLVGIESEIERIDDPWLWRTSLSIWRSRSN